MHNTYVFYTDGACSGNPGPGGYAVLSVSAQNDKQIPQVLCATCKEHTTNNEMELSAFLLALNSLRVKMEAGEDFKATIYSDSTYCVNAITKKWIHNWNRNKWKRSGSYIPNYKLWMGVYDVLFNKKLIDRVDIQWIKGHTNSNFGNDMVDKHAVIACKEQKTYVLKGSEIQ